MNKRYFDIDLNCTICATIFNSDWFYIIPTFKLDFTKYGFEFCFNWLKAELYIGIDKILKE